MLSAARVRSRASLDALGAAVGLWQEAARTAQQSGTVPVRLVKNTHLVVMVTSLGAHSLITTCPRHYYVPITELGNSAAFSCKISCVSAAGGPKYEKAVL